VILVTVGTHEQPFERLLREVDRLAETGRLEEEVFCQSGFGSYRPRVASAPMLEFDELQRMLTEASVVVSHGGPGTVLAALAAQRPLVLVPRQRRFGEHVDDHQVAFCRRVAADRGVRLVEDMAELEAAIAEARRRGPRVGPAGGGQEGVVKLGELITGLLEGR
jgi:UDP-N-acetylglucosamine transferase subunit ALG13